MTEITQMPPANLLFVDDEPNILKSLKRLFRGAEYNIFLAENGEAGLEILTNNPIDLIISDMRMPQMDGAEFLARAAERWPNSIRILLTGYADMESTINAVNKGKIYSYCSKPWEDNELKILVNNALEQKRLLDERQRLFAIIEQKNLELKEFNDQLENKVQLRTEQVRLSLQKLDNANAALKKQCTTTIKTFARIIEMRPGIKSGHSKYIAENAKELAQRMGMTADDVKDILYGGLLLQIGKISLPDDLLRQPLSDMTVAGKKRFLHHGQEGCNLLSGIDPLKNAAELILYQHENFDGSGEPYGLSGSQIPLGSRILAVVRDYISSLDGFFTGSALSTENAKKRLLLKKGSLYDPEVVDLFLTLLSESQIEDERPVIDISWTQLQPGMEAVEIIHNGMLYLKDQILSHTQIEKILEMRRHSKDLILRVRV
ncbi:HD domain-containing phosphohydrolase [Methylomonas methanica]|uniref:Response regulator receiver protein n=1 Tax=Methylomonas methanica (strain DSM 25384 / MC09) TaxID=857087 RepID=G0A623_METMM|nr:HD domain-containing phosphohydrolase [Methylomonas methanica]AEG00473.1 response regulator receiver protein [Methylomonas methanica MC09]